MRRGWIALMGLAFALAAIYVLLTGVFMTGARETGQEIGERSRQDLRELLREAGESG